MQPGSLFTRASVTVSTRESFPGCRLLLPSAIFRKLRTSVVRCRAERLRLRCAGKTAGKGKREDITVRRGNVLRVLPRVLLRVRKNGSRVSSSVGAYDCVAEDCVLGFLDKYLHLVSAFCTFQCYLCTKVKISIFHFTTLCTRGKEITSELRLIPKLHQQRPQTLED